MGLSCAKAEGMNNKAEKNRSTGKSAETSGTEFLARLVTGGVVAGFVKDAEGREAFGSAKLDLDFAPARVMRFVARMVSQNILVTQLHANFTGDVREILEPLD